MSLLCRTCGLDVSTRKFDRTLLSGPTVDDVRPLIIQVLEEQVSLVRVAISRSSYQWGDNKCKRGSLCCLPQFVERHWETSVTQALARTRWKYCEYIVACYKLDNYLLL